MSWKHFKWKEKQKATEKTSKEKLWDLTPTTGLWNLTMTQQEPEHVNP